MHFSDLKVAGAKLVQPDHFADERGLFKEVYSTRKYEALGDATFVQDNVSISGKGVLRGLHYDPRMAKLVQCLHGKIYDVVVDLREDSPTHGTWDGRELSGDNHQQMFIPAGCAHGFYVLSEFAIVMYKQTALYDPAHERTVRFDDPRYNVQWPLSGTPVLSPKDASA